MAVSRFKRSIIRADDIETARINNQIILYDTDKVYNTNEKGGLVFLEYAIAGAGTLDIKDKAGNTIVNGLANYDFSHSPLVLDEGIQITGTLAWAKAFYIDGGNR